MRLFSTLLLLSLLSLVACKSKQYVLADYEGLVLGFGNGGGFTGAMDYYKLLENGQLFRSTDGENYNEVQSFDKDTAVQMFSNFETLGLNNMRINDPGNMTFFVSMGQGDRVQKLSWGGGMQTPDAGLRQYYTTLIKLAGQSKNPIK